MAKSVEEDILYEPPPPPESSAKPQAESSLSAPQQKAYDEVLAHFTKKEYVLSGVEDGALRDEETFWLSHECILRYLRATKWAGSQAAVSRLETTLKWRREYGVYDLITAEYVEPEAVTGKMILFGYDADGRPALYLRPSKQNTEETIKQLHLVVWFLERSVDLMGPGVENIALMVDFADRAKNPSLGQARATLNILQDHYPERLGRALITKVPFLINAFFKLILPFVDPITREKIKFNPQCIKEGLFMPDMLMREWGGDARFDYVHERYWPALVRMCEERRGRMWRAWKAMGGKVGSSEWEMKTMDGGAEGKKGNEHEAEQQAGEATGAEVEQSAESGKAAPAVEASEAGVAIA